MSKKIKRFYPKSREEWRNWLQENHEKETSIGLIIYKKHTKKPTINHRVAMEEAICFGWIDTTANRIDEQKYMIKFVKRNKNSKWSNNTLSYALELQKQGKMSPAGLAAYKHGLSKPTHDFGIPENPETPEDLIKELIKSNSKINFDSFSKSYKKMLLRWLYRAKLKDTRQRRIQTIVNLAKTNNKKGIYSGKNN